MKRSKGFTLVEVLIVVVIIAILSALVVPRMLAQTEKAKAAEALQMVGAIKRALERTTALVGPGFSGEAYSDFGYRYGDWGSIGLKDPGEAKNWGYYFYYGDWGEGPYLCVDAWNSDWSSEIYYYVYSSHPEWGNGWSCYGIFTNGGDPSKPCTIA